MGCVNTTGMYLNVNTQICASGSASRSGNTVTVSGSFSCSQSNSWNLNAIYAHVSGRTGWVKVKPYSNSGGSWSANFSFSFTDANAGSATYTAIFQVYNNAESGGVGNTASTTFSASWASAVSQPANPSITLRESTNTSLAWRLHESNWGNSAGRWEWWFTNTNSYSGAADSTYNYTPTSGYTWNGTADVSKTNLTSNRVYWVHLRVYNQHYNNPGGVASSSWATKPQPGVFSVNDAVISATNYLPFPYSARPQQGNGITFTDNGDGSITLNGQNDGSAASKFYLFSGTTAGDPPITLEPGTYHFEAPPDDKIGFTVYDGTTYKGVNGPNWEFTITEQKTYTMMSVDVAKGSTANFNNVTFTPKLLDDKGEVKTKAIHWEQWTGNADFELRVNYRIEEGDRTTPAEDTWTRIATIPAGAGSREQTKTGDFNLTNLGMGKTYTVFLMTDNGNGHPEAGSGRTPVQRIVFTTDFPPDPELVAEWNDVRDTLNITATAAPQADEIQVCYGYNRNERIVINGINGKTSKTGKIQYPNHGEGQVLYIATRTRSGTNWTTWSEPVTYAVPNPILGILALPNGEKLNIIDIVEKKIGGKNLLRASDSETYSHGGVDTTIFNNDTDKLRIVVNGEITLRQNNGVWDGYWATISTRRNFTLSPGTYTMTISQPLNGSFTLIGYTNGQRPRCPNGTTWCDPFAIAAGQTSKTVTLTEPMTFGTMYISRPENSDHLVDWDFKIQLTKGDQPDTVFAPYEPGHVTPKWKNGQRVFKNP